MKAENPDVIAKVKDLAFELIHAKGVRGWCMSDLARKAGLAKNTLYKIAGSKEGLIERLVIDQLARTLTLLVSIIESEKEYRPAARRVLSEAPGYLAAAPRLAFREIFLEYPAIEKNTGQYREKANLALRDFLRKGMVEGDIRNDVTPDFLIDLIQGIVDHYLGSGLSGEALQDTLTKAFRCLREGVRQGDW